MQIFQLIFHSITGISAPGGGNLVPACQGRGARPAQRVRAVRPLPDGPAEVPRGRGAAGPRRLPHPRPLRQRVQRRRGAPPGRAIGRGRGLVSANRQNEANGGRVPSQPRCIVASTRQTSRGRAGVFAGVDPAAGRPEHQDQYPETSQCYEEEESHHFKPC